MVASLPQAPSRAVSSARAWTYFASLLQQLETEISQAEIPAPDREDALLAFVSTPLYLEKLLGFGMLLCTDALLFVLTILPLRAAYQVVRREWYSGGDLVRVIIMAITYRVLQSINASRVYHSVRGQTGITMFVMFSLMEVCDKFLCAIGNDMISSLSSLQNAGYRRRRAGYAIASLLYMLVHSFVLMWQLVTINLAVNSYSNALLSFMLTTQFGEIKGAVFKRYDGEALFQMTCADITQRFQYAAILLVIVLRNLLEVLVSGAMSWGALSQICGPPSIIMGAIILVDWLKLAYITNFNNLSPKPLFSSFIERLKNDFATNPQRGSQTLISKQAGLPVGPLAIVCVRMFAKGGVLVNRFTPILFVLFLAGKLVLGSWLRNVTSRESSPRELPPPRPLMLLAASAASTTADSLEGDDKERNGVPGDSGRSNIE